MDFKVNLYHVLLVGVVIV